MIGKRLAINHSSTKVRNRCIFIIVLTVRRLKLTSSNSSTNKPYRDKLESLIRIGEDLLTADLDLVVREEVQKHVNSLKVRLFKARIDDDLR